MKHCSLICFLALAAVASAAGDPSSAYSILRKPKYARDGDGAARGKIVNGFAKRPKVSRAIFHLQRQGCTS